jgi:uncharacterized YigZ family protein
MDDSYLTPAGFGEAEYIEKKSRFIGRVWRVTTEAEAQERIKQMRAQHADATHNVYAYILREGGIMRYSDDGEPGGTSGQPTLNVFRSGAIFDVCCVVTRYFGGILLGSGGLVRAYSNTARMALEKAGIAKMSLWTAFRVDCSYSLYERVLRLLESRGCVVEDQSFGEFVSVRFLVLTERGESTLATITELSGASAQCTPLGEVFRPAVI